MLQHGQQPLPAAGWHSGRANRLLTRPQLTSPRWSTAARRGSCARSASSACRSLSGTSRNRCSRRQESMCGCSNAWHMGRHATADLAMLQALQHRYACLLPPLCVAVWQVSILGICDHAESKQRRILGRHGCSDRLSGGRRGRQGWLRCSASLRDLVDQCQFARVVD